MNSNIKCTYTVDYTVGTLQTTLYLHCILHCSLQCSQRVHSVLHCSYVVFTVQLQCGYSVATCSYMQCRPTYILHTLCIFPTKLHEILYTVLHCTTLCYTVVHVFYTCSYILHYTVLQCSTVQKISCILYVFFVECMYFYCFSTVQLHCKYTVATLQLHCSYTVFYTVYTPCIYRATLQLYTTDFFSVLYRYIYIKYLTKNKNGSYIMLQYIIFKIK